MAQNQHPLPSPEKAVEDAREHYQKYLEFAIRLAEVQLDNFSEYALN